MNFTILSLLLRTKLFEKNRELEAELDSVSENFRTFHKDTSEKKNKVRHYCC